MALQKTFSLANCTFTWNGLPLSSGVGKDSVLTASREFDGVTVEGNARGDNARTRNVNKLGHIEFTLMRSSTVAGLLAAQAKLYEEAVADYEFNFTVVDPSTNIQLTARNCWVRKVPDIEITNSANEITFMFDCDELEQIPVPDLQ